MEDPYQVLNLDPKSSIDEVSKAYFYIAKIYHPNKGGNESEFLRFQKAYKQILDSHQKGHSYGAKGSRDHYQLKTGSKNALTRDMQHQYKPRDFGQHSFNNDKFNNEFQQTKNYDDHNYTYNIDEITEDRNAEDYKREYAALTSELENIIPFGNGSFNNTTFNQVFSHMKEQHKKESGDVEEYIEPQAVYSKDVELCTNLDAPKDPGSGCYSNYNVYKKCHSNPDKYNNEFMTRFRDMPDLTRVNKLSTSEATKRINNRNNTSLVYNSEKLVTDPMVPINKTPVQQPEDQYSQHQAQQYSQPETQQYSQHEAQQYSQHEAQQYSQHQPQAQTQQYSQPQTQQYSQHQSQQYSQPQVQQYSQPQVQPQVQAQAQQYSQHQAQQYSQHQAQQYSQHQAKVKYEPPPIIRRKKHSKRRMESEIQELKYELRAQNKLIKKLAKNLT
jgi:curved DNA-binding protein CbpA